MLKQLGIERVTIELPFRLNHVNCFLAKNSDGYVVIDTGLHRDHTKKVWQEVLRNKKVKNIIVTHLHPDHSGYAGQLQKETNANVLMTKADRNSMDKIWSDQAIPKVREDFERAAVPEETIQGILNVIQTFRTHTNPFPNVNYYLEEGDKLEIGNGMYEVIRTPGHSAGLIVLYNKEANALLATDHILPHITPNISYWFYGEVNPLQSYENSLQKMKQYEAEFVIPSHGDPFYDANKRIDEIWNHHIERLEETLDYIKDGATVYEVCEKLFPQQLTFHEQQFAIGETISHLEYLRAKGECSRDLLNKQWIYEKA